MLGFKSLFLQTCFSCCAAFTRRVGGKPARARWALLMFEQTLPLLELGTGLETLLERTFACCCCCCCVAFAPRSFPRFSAKAASTFVRSGRGKSSERMPGQPGSEPCFCTTASGFASCKAPASKSGGFTGGTCQFPPTPPLHSDMSVLLHSVKSFHGHLSCPGRQRIFRCVRITFVLCHQVKDERRRSPEPLRIRG